MQLPVTEAARFWSDLNKDFRKARKRWPQARDLHATAAFEDGDPKQLSETLGDKAILAVQSPLADPYLFARLAARAAAAYVDQTYIRDYWVISGGPGNESERLGLLDRFLSLAERAAKGAKLVLPSESPDRAAQTWLHFLRDHLSAKSPYRLMLGIGIFEDLCGASAALCYRLATAAQAAGATSATQPQPSTSQTATASLSACVPVKKAAKLLGVHVDTVIRNVKNGRISGICVGKRWVVPQAELKRLYETGNYRRPPPARR